MYVSMAPTAIAGTAILGFELSRQDDSSATRLASTGWDALPLSLLALAIIAFGLALVALGAHRARR